MTNTFLALCDENYNFKQSTYNKTTPLGFNSYGCCQFIKWESIKYDYSMEQTKFIVGFCSELSVKEIESYFNNLSKIGFKVNLITDNETVSKLLPNLLEYCKKSAALDRLNSNVYFYEINSNDFPNMLLFYSTFVLARYIYLNDWYICVKEIMKLNKEFSKRWSFFRCIQIAQLGKAYGDTYSFISSQSSMCSIQFNKVLIPQKIEEFIQKIDITNSNFVSNNIDNNFKYKDNKASWLIPNLFGNHLVKELDSSNTSEIYKLVHSKEYEKLNNYLRKISDNG